jgi:hypothetical protein
MDKNKPGILIQLHLRCERLRRCDTFSKSDPYVVLLWPQHGELVRTGQEYVGMQELGRTETIENSHSPTFATPIRAEYFFEERQEVLVEVRDDDGNGTYDVVGRAEVTLAQLITTWPPGSTCSDAIELTHGKSHSKAGVMYAHTEEIMTKVRPQAGQHPKTSTALPADARLCLRISGQKLAAKDSMFKTLGRPSSDPYCVVSRAINGDTTTLVELGRTNILKRNLNPHWDDLLIEANLDSLAGGQLYFKVWDKDTFSKDDLIGETQVPLSVAPLLECSTAGLSTEGAPLTLHDTTKVSSRCQQLSQGTVAVTAWLSTSHGRIACTAGPSELLAISESRNLVRERSDSWGNGSVQFTDLTAPHPGSLSRTSREHYHLVSPLPHLRDGAGAHAYPMMPPSLSLMMALGAGLQLETSCAIDYTGSNGSMHSVSGPTDNPYQVWW